MTIRFVICTMLAALVSTSALAQDRTLNIVSHAVHKRVAHGEGEGAKGGDVAGEWATRNNVTLNWITMNVDPIHERLLRELGSGPIDHRQKMTVAARATAEKKTVGHRS